MSLKECIVSKIKKPFIVDTNFQKKIKFYILDKNKKDIFYEGKLVDIRDQEFEIDISKLQGFKTIIFKDLTGDTLEFTYWFTDKQGRLRDYPLVDGQPPMLTYVKTLKNSLILYSSKEKTAFTQLSKYFNKLPDNFTINLKMIKMIPYGNKQNIAGTTKDGVTTLFKYSQYTIAEKKNILYHEIAHTWADKLMDKKIIDYSYTDYQEIVKKDNNYVSSYAEKFASQHGSRVSEDFADGVAFYFIDEKKFAKKYPNRTQYFKELLRKRNKIKGEIKMSTKDWEEGFEAGKQFFINKIKDKMKQLEDKHNNFDDMTVFNVPRQIESDFMKYLTYKEIIKND